MDIERPHINIRFHSFGGTRTPLLEISRSCDLPQYLYNTNFKFALKEHVRIEVFGGTILLIGTSQVGSSPTTIINEFQANCPFSDFDKA